MAGHSQHIYAFYLSSKSRCWFERFLDCSLCCSTSVLWVDIRVYTFLGWWRRLACNQAAFRDTSIKTEDGGLYRLCLYWYGLVLIHRIHTSCFHVVKQSTSKVIIGHYVTTLHTVHVARLLKLDTLPPFFYYELYIYSKSKYWMLHLPFEAFLA